MEEKYKIGLISKIFGIPVQTLRYYEQLGIMTPQVDEASKYRYYNAWILNDLLDAKYLRAYDFSNQETANLIHESTLDEYMASFEAQEDKITEQLIHYEHLLTEIREKRSLLGEFNKHIGNFCDSRSGAEFFQPYREKNHYIDSESQEKLLSHLSWWLDYLPFVKPTFIVKCDSINVSEPDHLIYQWGFSASPGMAKENNINKLENTTFCEPRESLYTVFYAGGENTFEDSLTDQVIKPILKQGYTISADIIGHLILRIHEDGQQRRYFEVWIPYV